MYKLSTIKTDYNNEFLAIIFCRNGMKIEHENCAKCKCLPAIKLFCGIPFGWAQNAMLGKSPHV